MKSFETVKGLECCQTYHECSKCPYNTGSADTDECKSECMRDAAELINEKQTEIERLQHILISFMNEVEVLERKYGADTSNIPAIAVLGTERENIIKEIETEAIKKFAHQLKILLETKAKLYSLSDKDCEFAIVQSTALKTVDNLVKEKVGDDNA